MRLRLGDQFETDKGSFVVTGIQFSQGKRIGVLIKPYRVENDPHYQAKFVDDELFENNEYKYKGNKILGDVQ